MKRCLFIALGVWFVQMSCAQQFDLETIVKSVTDGKKATVGVAVSTDDGKVQAVNDAVHFPLMSVFKFHGALAVLHELDRKQLPLETELLISKDDLTPNTYSPLRDKYPNGNFKMSIADLLKYSISLSDNNACDILLNYVGGPAVVDAYVKRLDVDGFSITATERLMNGKVGNEKLNWTVPSSTVRVLKAFFDRSLFASKYKRFLEQIMIETSTGMNKLRAGLPDDVVLGHKTGSSMRTEAGVRIADNDAGFVRLPDGRQYYIAVFVMNSLEDDATNAAMIAEISRKVYEAMKTHMPVSTL